ncbi:uncharacterized protein B0H64DRAFT_443802 [Chaetomium fimeti]|uniref:rRNA-processing protein FYV7 n=1 Tax=Chaetomium fimeti TaxID=1854472 RepID=A0AAE0HFK4_9PEZI|nr:hypothetical protein B0H64DRAFT_443802 [Chaetomium fimeti]
MPAKRPRDEDAVHGAGPSSTTDETRKPKKAKHGFRVGPENLPDGAWRRKVTKIKKDLITKAKVKKQYAKIKAEHQKQAPAPAPEDHTQAEDGTEPTTHPNQEEDGTEPPPVQIHPERQAMLDAPTSRPKPGHQHQHQQQQQQQPTTETDPSSPTHQQQQQQQPHDQKPPRRKAHRPDYYTKELAAAERAKQQAAERAAEAAAREQERQRRVAERERYRKAMAKAKTPGRDGRVKIGRESKLLLERVQRVVGRG